MQVSLQPQINKYNKQTSFTSSPVQSNLFKPIAKQYDKLTDDIARKYYVSFYESRFAKWFNDKTKNVKNMTTHMAAIGSTLISGMYTIRTLQNDKLDPQKRKTLALNDVMTWVIATAGSYLADAKLANWWEGVTTRFASNYILDNPKAKRINTLGDWDSAKIYEMIGYEYEKRENGKKVKVKVPGKYSELINKRIDKINMAINDSSYTGLRKPLQRIESGVKNIRDFNLDVLKNRRLTTLIDGMGVLKSLFVFGMVYRYIVPVLVMKPANKLGAYLHKQNDEKEQQAKKA